MKSPVDGSPMKKKLMYNQIIFKNEMVSFKQEYWLCRRSGCKFTTTEMDERNLQRVIDAYEEIINIEL